MKRRSIVAAATSAGLLLTRAWAQAPALQRPARIGWPASAGQAVVADFVARRRELVLAPAEEMSSYASNCAASPR